jgi:precorrin-6A synthase
MLLIGIGVGDPSQLTVEAMKAMNASEVFFVIEKGPEKAELTSLRRELCDRCIDHDNWRIVEVADAERDRAAADYVAAVERWRSSRAQRLEQAIITELRDEQCGALLLWGDPSLYDSTIGVLDEIVKRRRIELTYQVIPGITSVQALAAAHQIPLNAIGGQLRITTGRRLRAQLAAEGDPQSHDGGARELGAEEGVLAEGESVVVMLDAECSFKALAGQGIEIYWGANLGTEDQRLISGIVEDVTQRIERERAAVRARKGWVMDTYLLRRR